ncbi:type II toxin-antitoxin system ParD family antitoxin [bacterium]|nr:type II toxin-antitoxin system ParD family antitoxin [bacterium]
MARDTSISPSSHFANIVAERVAVVRAGTRPLEQEEAKLDLLRQTLAAGEAELDQGQGLDGEDVMSRLIG